MDRYLVIKGKSTIDFNDDEIKILEELSELLMNGVIMRSKLDVEFFNRSGREVSSKVLYGWLERMRDWKRQQVSSLVCFNSYMLIKTF